MRNRACLLSKVFDLRRIGVGTLLLRYLIDFFLFFIPYWGIPRTIALLGVVIFKIYR